MKTLKELLEFGVETSKEAKAGSAQRGERMMAPTLVVFRGDQQIAIVVAGTEGSSDLVRAARMCIVGFAADTLVLAMDTFMATIQENPRTGEPWGHGEMQEVAEKHQGIERGWVSDAVHVTVVNRACDVVADTFAYRKASRHRVEWTGSGYASTFKTSDGPLQVGGWIPEQLRKAMNEPTLLHKMREEGLNAEDFGLHEHDRMMAHQDLGVAKVLHLHGCTVAFTSTAGSVRDEVLRASADTRGI